MVSYRVSCALAAALALPAALSAAPYLVEDLNPNPSEELQYVRQWEWVTGPDGVSYFSATDPAHGTELWRTDGTPAGTYRVTDVCAGRCSSYPTPARIFRGEVYFSANDGFSGIELWATDGTPGGERRVRDLCGGPCSSSPEFFEEAGGSLFFFASIGPRLQLWKTDGTRDGTVRLKHICSRVNDINVLCDAYPGLFAAGDRAFFFGEGGYEADLWVTDGTAAGTRPFKEALAGAPDPEGVYLSLIPGPGFAWVWATDGLWRSDGTEAGTWRLKSRTELSLEPVGYESPGSVVVVDGVLLGNLGSRLIRSDGTPEGTHRLLEIAHGASVGDLVALGDGVLFSVYHPDKSESVWFSRGTVETSRPVIDLGSAGFFILLVGLKDRALFIRRELEGDDFRTDVWSTDSTAAGTHRLDLSGGPPELGAIVPGGRLGYFLRFNDYWNASDLWTSDGSDAGTRRVRDFRAAPGSSGPLEQTAVGERLLFSAQTGVDSAPLFLSDGTAAGTRVLSTDASWASGFSRLGRLLFFTSLERSNFSFSYKGLWKTDATAAGTVPAVPELNGVRDATTYRGSLYWDSGELFKTDGTARGSVLIKDINPYQVDTGFHHTCIGEASSPLPAVVLRDRLLLTADDGRNGRELWVTDGTARGTQLFLDVNPLRSPEVPPSCENDPRPRTDTGLSSNPDDFVELGSIALFSATDGRTGRELWRTDGTPQRTRRVADLRPGPPGSAPHGLVAWHGRVYFFASATGAGEALWRTDGTARGTELVRDLAVGGFPSWGRDLMVAGDRLFFVVFNETTGAELWVSGGEAASTALVGDLNPGPASGSPQSLTDVDGVLVFAADDGLTGLEPWRSDGTPAGTFPLADLSPGPEASSPGPFTRLREVLVTGADDGARGREPWAIPLGDVLTP